MNRFKFVSSFSKVSDVLDAVSLVMRILTLLLIIVQSVAIFKDAKDITAQ